MLDFINARSEYDLTRSVWILHLNVHNALYDITQMQYVVYEINLHCLGVTRSKGVGRPLAVPSPPLPSCFWLSFDVYCPFCSPSPPPTPPLVPPFSPHSYFPFVSPFLSYILSPLYFIFSSELFPDHVYDSTLLSTLSNKRHFTTVAGER